MKELKQLGVERKNLPLDVAKAADIVSVHVALKPDTRSLIGTDFFNSNERRRLLHQYCARRSRRSGGFGRSDAFEGHSRRARRVRG